MASDVEEQPPNHRSLKRKETEIEISIFEIIRQGGIYTICLIPSGIFHVPKLISKDNSEGQLFFI